MMNRESIYICALTLLAAFAAGSCEQQRTLYSDAEYVMFADPESVNYIQEQARTFQVPVASTVTCDYDRTFAVEVIDSKSKAIEGLHYRLSSNTLTIKAGQHVGNVEITADYDRMEAGDTLNVALRLVMPEAVKWDLYGNETNVKMLKSCPFVWEEYTGWCLVTSMLLYNYPGMNTSIQRLIYTEKHPTMENMVILHNFLYDNYDVTMQFEPDDPARPLVTMDEDQVLGDTRTVFWTTHGDGKILVTHSPYYLSYFNSCQHFALLYLYVYVEDLGEAYGVVDPYSQTILEWVSDEEADRLEREEGLEKSWYR